MSTNEELEARIVRLEYDLMRLSNVTADLSKVIVQYIKNSGDGGK